MKLENNTEIAQTEGQQESSGLNLVTVAESGSAAASSAATDSSRKPDLPGKLPNFDITDSITKCGPQDKCMNFQPQENPVLPLAIDHGKDGSIVHANNGYTVLINHEGVQVRDAKGNVVKPDGKHLGAPSYEGAGVTVGPQGPESENHKLHNKVVFDVKGTRYVMDTNNFSVQQYPSFTFKK